MFLNRGTKYFKRLYQFQAIIFVNLITIINLTWFQIIYMFAFLKMYIKNKNKTENLRKLLWKKFVDRTLQFILQGTVVNYIGPVRLAGPTAINSNYCRQYILFLHDPFLEALTVYNNELCLFGDKAFPLLLILLILRIWHGSSRYNF